MHLLSPLNGKKVLLGMSGGTDSSVAAMLLQEAGCEVIGVTFRFFDKKGDNSIDDAGEIADRLGIEHFVYDARGLFREKIIDYFINEYMDGRTPVPCMECNRLIKWPLLSDIAKERGIYRISTGHYARIVQQNGRRLIAKGRDPDKEQSFFLWGIPETIRERMVLPLGGLLKSDVRKIANERGFTKTAQKKDSIGVCFCPGDYHAFLREQTAGENIEPGFFVDEKGNILGKHNGYPFYTVGQRRGLRLNLQHPAYVKEICKESNRITLSQLTGLYKKEMIVSDFELCNPDGFYEGRKAVCKIRYRKQATPSIVKLLDGKHLHVKFIEPLEMVAPGQAAAFYDGEVLIGGGIIDSSQ